MHLLARLPLVFATVLFTLPKLAATRWGAFLPMTSLQLVVLTFALPGLADYPEHEIYSFFEVDNPARAGR